MHFSAKYSGEQNPFGIPSQASPKKSSKRNSKAKEVASQNKFNTGRWTTEEHELFLEAIELYWRDWKKVHAHKLGLTLKSVISSWLG